MRIHLKTIIYKCCISGLALLLASCAQIAPGMRVERELAPEPAVHALPAITPITAGLVLAQNTLQASLPDQDIGPLLGAPQPYVIGNGDLLSIFVWDHPELNGPALIPQTFAGTLPSVSAGGVQAPTYSVDHNGMIQFPLVGPFKLAGLTEMQARDLLVRRLVRSIKKPDLTLRVQGFRSQRVFIDGEVKVPGSVVIDDVPMTLLEGLTRAGGLLPTADRSRIAVVRGGVSYPVDLPALVRKGMDPTKIMLAAGDLVRVRGLDESKVFVLGEVTTPKALVMHNGQLSLNEALGEVGGLNPMTSAGRQVYVIRNVEAQEPSVYHLDARSPVALALAENFQLKPRDVVYVDATPLVRFGRVLSAIIPTSSVISQTVK
jgi:polysaccharide export outer membrane protein